MPKNTISVKFVEFALISRKTSPPLSLILDETSLSFKIVNYAPAIKITLAVVYSISSETRDTVILVYKGFQANLLCIRGFNSILEIQLTTIVLTI